MNAQKRAFIEQKVKGMDNPYFTNVSKHLSHFDKSCNELLNEQKQALCHYFVAGFEIAEAKYIGYWKLLEDVHTELEESAVENEFKEKIKELEQKRRQYAEQIERLHEMLLDLIKQSFPLDSYDSVYFSDDGKMYPREDGELRSVS